MVGGRKLNLRVSTHPASGHRIGNSDADDKVSIVIYKNGEHYSKEEHAGYVEYIYDEKDVSLNDAANAVLKGVINLIENGKYIDETQKAKFQEYPYEDEQGNTRFRVGDDYEAIEGGVRFKIVDNEEVIKKFETDPIEDLKSVKAEAEKPAKTTKPATKKDVKQTKLQKEIKSRLESEWDDAPKAEKTKPEVKAEEDITEVGKYPEELFKGIEDIEDAEDAALATELIKESYEEYGQVAPLSEIIEYRDAYKKLLEIQGKMFDAINDDNVTEDEYEDLLGDEWDAQQEFDAKERVRRPSPSSARLVAIARRGQRVWRPLHNPNARLLHRPWRS